MGFSSFDDFLNKTTNLGVSAALQTYRYEWNKVTGGSAYTIGRWYDLNLTYGNPSAMTYGNMVVNSGPYNSAWGWTVGANWTYTAGSPTGTFVHAATSTATLSQPSISFTNGVAYLVIYTVAAFTSGTVTVSINGTSGTARGSAATFAETITAGAAGGLAFTPSSTAALSVSNVFVIQALQSYQLIDTNTQIGGIYHGGNVDPATKYILNAGAVATAATGVPSQLMLCDFLLAYPGINLNTSTIQNFLNANALPRYTTGVGVKAFMVYSYGAPTNVAQNINVAYTNTVVAAPQGQTMSAVVWNQGANADVVGHIAHAGVGVAATPNMGPFLPLYAGDIGVKQMDSVILSAAGGAGTYATMILCKPLLTLPLTTAFVMSERNFMNQFSTMPRVYDGAYLGWLYYAGAATAANTNFSGYLDFAWGQ